MFFLLHKLTGTVSPIDVQWHQLEQLQDQRESGLNNSKKGGTHKEPHLKYPHFEFTNTIVRCLLQQFSAPLPTSKSNWAWLLTRQRHKAACDDGLSSTPLVPHFRFSRHIASPGETRTITSCTWKKETKSDGPQFAKTEHTDATNLTEFPWKHLSKRQKPPLRMQSAPLQTWFRNYTKPQTPSPQGD